MNQKQKSVLALAGAIMANMPKDAKPSQEEIEKAKQELNKHLQELAIMVGFYTNALLDKLESLSKYGVIWAKSLKRFGNLFRENLATNENRTWKHIAEDKQQDNFFAVCSYMDLMLSSTVNFSNEQFMTLLQAIEMINKNEFVEVENQSQLSSLLQGKEVINEAIKYVESKPKISQLETLQYLRSLV